MHFENAHYFAMLYLNDWYAYDRRFVDGLSPANPVSERLKCLQEAVTYYSVARTLKNIDEDARLGKALEITDAVGVPITDENVDAVVKEVARALESQYGKYAVSAASKLLWIRHRSPVIIYDSRAVARLNVTASPRVGGGYYTPYRTEWLRQFDACASAIQTACDDLVNGKRFSLADRVPDDEVAKLVATRWFHERVFDKFLWTRGGD